MTETARRMFKLNRIELPLGVAIDDIRLGDEDRLAPNISVQTALDMQPVISDLRMKLLLALNGREFITSDHPTVTTNQRFQDRTKPPLSGLAMRGIQIVLPVSPSVPVGALKLKEEAKYLSISPVSVRRLIRRGLITPNRALRTF